MLYKIKIIPAKEVKSKDKLNFFFCLISKLGHYPVVYHKNHQAVAERPRVVYLGPSEPFSLPS